MAWLVTESLEYSLERSDPAPDAHVANGQSEAFAAMSALHEARMQMLEEA